MEIIIINAKKMQSMEIINAKEMRGNYKWTELEKC